MEVQLQQGSELPLFQCPTVGTVLRPQRCSYDPIALAGRALVVDNGSHSFRAGWAGDASPSVVFRSAICKPRPKQGLASRAVVGEWGPGLSGWDFGKHTHRSCFESDVSINMEGQEALMDWALDRMGLAGDCVDHPLLLTEPPLVPSGARSQLAQLLFEAYGVPALSFVAAAPAAFYHHYSQVQRGWQPAVLDAEQQQLLQQSGWFQEAYCGSSSALVVCSGHSYTYVVPVYKGQPQWGASMRCWAAGSSCTSHLQQLLALHHPLHANGLLGNWQLAEGIKEAFCFASGDYTAQLRAAAAHPATAGNLALRVQLPYVPPSGPPKPTPMDLAVRAQEAKARGKALAEQRRHKVLEEKEEQLAVLLDLQAGAAEAADGGAGAAGSLGGREELDRQITELTAEVDRLRGQLTQNHTTPTPPPAAAAAPPPQAAAETAATPMDIDSAAAAAGPGPAAAADGGAASLPAGASPAPAAAAAADSVGAESSAAGAVTTTTNDPGIEADNEYEADDADSSATVTDDDGPRATRGTAAAAPAADGQAAAAAAAAQDAALDPAAAAAMPVGAGNDSSATVSDQGRLAGTAAAADGGGDDDDSSATVSDEGLGEQTELMQEVLQQVKQVRKQQRQKNKQQQQQQQLQQQVSLQPQGHPPEQQQQQLQQLPPQPAQPPVQQQQQQQQRQRRPPPQPPVVNPGEINYLGIPDEMLTADQIKIKRRQQLLHAGRMARERAAARKLQQQRERDAMMRVEDQQLASDPFAYLQQLQQRHNSAAARVEARKRRRLGATTAQQHQAEAEEGEQQQALVTGRAARRDDRHRERMRLIAQAAAPTQRKPGKDKRDKKRDKRDNRRDKRDKKKGSAADGSESEEGFGDDGADWEVYRAMDMRDSDSDVAAAEEAELNWTSQRMQQIGAAVASAATATLAAAAAAAAAGEAAEDLLMPDTAAAAAPAPAAPDAAAAAAAAAAAGSDTAAAAAAGGGGGGGQGNFLESAAAAIAGQLCTLAYIPQNPAAADSSIPQLSEALAGLDLNLLGLGGLGFGEVLGTSQPTVQLTAEDYQLVLGIERVRVPELLMQPAALAGVDQAGLPEVVGLVLKRLPGHVAAAVAAGGVVLTGGNMLFPGLLPRLSAELASIRPPGQPMPIYISSEPVLDTWRGAAALAAATGRTGAAAAAAPRAMNGTAAAAGGGGSSDGGAGDDGFLFPDPFADGALTRAVYEECGLDYLKEFRGFKYPDL